MMITDKQGHKRLKRPSPFLGACVAVAVLALLLVIYNFSKPVPMVDHHHRCGLQGWQ